MASANTSFCVFRLYTITGSFTMFAFFNWMASTKEIILLFFLGVAVRSSTKQGLKFFSISTLSVEVA